MIELHDPLAQASWEATPCTAAPALYLIGPHALVGHEEGWGGGEGGGGGQSQHQKSVQHAYLLQRQ